MGKGWEMEVNMQAEEAGRRPADEQARHQQSCKGTTVKPQRFISSIIIANKKI